MPNTRPLSPYEEQYLKSQGIDPSGLSAVDDTPQPEKPGIASTIGRTLLAHSPGMIGGGIGLAAAAPFTGGLSLIPAAVIGAGAAMGGSYLGQKGAETAAPDTMAKLEQSQEEAAKENPITAGATDIVGSALAGGGSLSLKNLGSAGRQLIGRNALSAVDSKALADIGEEALSPSGANNLIAQNAGKEALGKIGASAILNPAINTGLDLATGHTPTIGGIAGQVAGGALFSEQSNLGEWMHSIGHHEDEPVPETQSKDITTQPTQLEDDSSLIGQSPIKILDESVSPKDYLSKIKAANQDSQGTAIDPNRPTDTTVQPTTATEQPSEYDNVTELNKVKPPVTEANPTEFSPITGNETPVPDRSVQEGLQAIRDNQLRLSQQTEDRGATVDAFQPKNAVSNADTTTSTQAAETAARQTSLVDAMREYHNSVISGEGIQAARDKLDGEQQKFNYHVQELAKADQLRRTAIDNETAAQAGQASPLDRQRAFEAARIEQAKQQSTPETTQEGQGFLEKPNTQRTLDPDTTLNQNLSKTPGLDAWLENLKIKDNGELHGGLSGISTAVWNGSIDAVRLGVRAGKAVHDAIKDGINYIKSNHPGLKFNEDEYTKQVTESEKLNATNEGSKQEVVQPEREGTSSNRTSSEASSGNRILSSKGKEVIPQVKKLAVIGGVTQPLHDRIGGLPHPDARELSSGLKLVDNTRDQYLGESWGKIKTFADKIGLNKADEAQLDKVSRWENLNHAKAPLSMFTVKQRQMYNLERQVYDSVGKRRIINNEPVTRDGKPTKLVQDPTSHPTPVNTKIIEMYRAGTDTAGIKKADAEFIKNAVAHGNTPEKAASLLQDFRSSIQGKSAGSNVNLSFFGGSRLPQGTPLPESFTRGSYLNRLESYYKRTSLDNAYYKHIESNPRIMSALGETKDSWGNPIPKSNNVIANNEDVRTALDHLQGQAQDTTTKTEGGVTNLATTMFASTPVIEMHKILSNTINGAVAIADNPVDAVRTFGHMITHLSDGIQHATEGGLYKPTAKSVSDFFDRSATTAERFQALSVGLRNISSIGDLTNKVNSGLLQSSFEYAIPGKIAKANAGDVTAQQLLKKWDPSYEVGKTYSQKEIQNLASVAGSYVHGTKDGRTMPAIMLKDTEISGFLSLAHWSMSQTNRFMSDIYTPATKGNYTPLANALLGSAVGGYVIRQLREALQGKHGNTPDLQEISASQGGLAGNKGLVTYNLIGALQYAGFAGILSQAAKWPVDKLYKNSAQGEVFPLDEISSDLSKQIGDFTSAKANDPNFDWGHASIALINHIMTTDIQLARIGFNQGVNSGLITGSLAEKKELSDKLGQLRRFDMVSNLPYDDQEPSQANAYENIEQRRFKQTQDIGSAMQQLPGLVKNIINTYGDRPDVMMSKLKALKENQYETMPDLKSKAPSFVKYMSYLGTLKGKQEADNEYMDYMSHKITNEAKASAVP